MDGCTCSQGSIQYFPVNRKKVADRGKASYPHENEKGLIKRDYHVLATKGSDILILIETNVIVFSIKIFFNNPKLCCPCVAIGGSEVENYSS